ncbi:MAG TPA: hypothetical protein VGG99_01275 [Acetobacteraceae bacterium]|jgi:hypothetical protein
MAGFGALPIGTLIVARSDRGPIVKGQPGIIAGPPAGSRLLWWRRAYPCVFLGCIHVPMPRRRVKVLSHDVCCQMLEHPYWFLHTRSVAAMYREPEAGPRRSSFWSG